MRRCVGCDRKAKEAGICRENHPIDTSDVCIECGNADLCVDCDCDHTHIKREDEQVVAFVS